VTYEGTVAAMQELKEFLQPQLRAAADKKITVSYLLTFADGLPLAGQDAENFGGKLARMGSVTAFVKATAKRR
jgi:hypothetical protein